MTVFKLKNIILILGGVLTLFTAAACWDTPNHDYDSINPGSGDTGAADSDTGNTEIGDTGYEDSDRTVNSVLDSDWQGFGQGCEDVSECSDYPSGEKRCIHQVMGLIKSPGGYCTACCNEENKRDACGPGIDCVGANNAYLICMARCNTDADCRTEDHYECRSIYYLNQVLPDNYCMVDEEHMNPEPGDGEDITCPWPWTE